MEKYCFTYYHLNSHPTDQFYFQMGCVLCILGSILIVIHAPHEEEFESIDELLSKISDADFLYYLFLVAVTVISIIFFLGPHYGNRYVAVYVALCSATGSLTVMSCKALGLAIRSAITGMLL